MCALKFEVKQMQYSSWYICHVEINVGGQDKIKNRKAEGTLGIAKANGVMHFAHSSFGGIHNLHWSLCGEHKMMFTAGRSICPSRHTDFHMSLNFSFFLAPVVNWSSHEYYPCRRSMSSHLARGTDGGERGSLQCRRQVIIQ